MLRLVFRKAGSLLAPSADMKEGIPVGPLRLRIVDQRNKASAVECELLRDGGAGEFGKRRKDVVVSSQTVHIDAGLDLAGQSEEEGDSRSAFVCSCLVAFHTGVVWQERVAAIVAHENEQGIIRQAPLVQLVHQEAHVFIDIGDHAKVCGCVFWVLVLIHRLVLPIDNPWAVWRVCRNVGKERLVLVIAALHPAQRLPEEDVCAVSGRFDERVVVLDDWIEVLGARSIGLAARIAHPDSASAMDESLIKSAVVGLVFVFITKVPLPKDAGGITGILQDFRDGRCLECHTISFENRMGDTILERSAAGDQRGTAGRAGGAGVKVGKACGLGVQFVQIWSLQEGVPVTAEIPISLVVRHDQNNVRPVCSDQVRWCHIRRCRNSKCRDSLGKIAAVYGTSIHCGSLTERIPEPRNAVQAAFTCPKRHLPK